MNRSTDRILTTHAGGLTRTEELRELLAAGESDARGRAEAVRVAVADLVRQQEEIGIDIVGDGEQGRPVDAQYVVEHLDGFELLPPREQVETDRRPRWDFPEFYKRAYPGGRRSDDRAHCVGTITWRAEDAIRETIDDLRSAAGDASVADLFLTAPSPSNIARQHPNDFYSTQDDYEVALADAMREEYQAITSAGLSLAVELRWPGTRSQLHHDVELLNHALRDTPPEAARLHLTFDPAEAPHNHDPELADIVDVLLEARPSGLALVAANGRHECDCHVWADTALPADKALVIGVIDSTTNIVEHPYTVADRLTRYAGYVGRENVIAGVDGRFEPDPGLYQEFRVTGDVMWAKLNSLVKGAELASARLWS